ncbi:MAG: GxxExxY protein [Sphingorhabdus sp.]
MKPTDEISRDIIGVSMAIHREIGPGLIESVYQAILAKKLAQLGYSVEVEKPLGFSFEDLEFPSAFKVDLLVDGRLVIELKSVERLQPVHAKQLLTYLSYEIACWFGDKLRMRYSQRRGKAGGQQP